VDDERDRFLGSRLLGLSSGSVDPAVLNGVIAISIIFGASTLVLAIRLWVRRTNLLGVWGVLSFTFREAIRTKWLMTFAVIFFLLAANLPVKILSDLNSLPKGYEQLGFSTLLLAAFPLIPLLALPIGAVSIVDDRESGTMQYLLSNPITKFDFFLGRIAGLLLATTTVIFVGFGGAAVLVYLSDIGQFRTILILTLTAGLLNAVMLALALIVSEVSKRKATAIGVAIFLWFLLTTVSGLDTLTYAVYWRSQTAALSLVLLDPVETSRIVAIKAANLNQTQSFGQTDYMAQHLLHGNLLPVAVGSVLAWLVFLIIVGFLVFRHQDAS
jgi:ABC-type transport system involved in multi-copper enzyme maturation permease subunit